MSRILIAEDDNGIAEFIARGLESAGYSCDVTDNGPVAFGMARSGAYQLMILDLGLPNMDGTDILEQLRSLGTTLPIIVLTARTALEDRLRTLEGGANDYMPKPFQFAELLAGVATTVTEVTVAETGTGATGTIVVAATTGVTVIVAATAVIGATATGGSNPTPVM